MQISAQYPFKQFLQAWVWAGIDSQSPKNISPVRITNIVSLIIIWAIIAQLPMALLHYDQGGQHKIILVCIFSTSLCLIPCINLYKKYLTASVLLTLLYAAYIGFSVMLWPVNLHTQYFLILGCAMLPFLFDQQQGQMALLLSLLFCTLFVLLEYRLPKQVEIQLLSEYHANILISNRLTLAFATLLTSWHIRKNLLNGWRKLALEHQRSEKLLLNMLPQQIAERLKIKKKLVADHFDQASVLFADISDFTSIVKQRSPDELVSLLNDIFSQFDELCRVHGLEKIKTMGDEYMAVCGLPTSRDDHAIRACKCAQAMQQSYHQICRTYRLHSSLRIGIASGEVVAGVIGKNKYTYDIWGDTVNLASRMESQGKKGHIQVSANTYQLAKHHCQFTLRGTVPIRGIGDIECYWLKKEDDVPTAQF